MSKGKCSTEVPRIFKRDVNYFSTNRINEILKIVNALSDPIRLQIIYLLEEHEDICTCEFQELLDLSQSKVSYHLKILVDANILERKVMGNWRHYNLVKKDLLKKIEFLLD